jgi:diguanylate cyclase
MRYQESSSQSAELLRQLLPYMARHGGVYHPTHYAVWYEFLAAINPALKEVLAARLAQPETVTGEEIAQLHERFLSTRDKQSVERMQQGFLVLLRQLATVAASAGQNADEFSRELEEASGLLTGEIDADGLRQLVEGLAAKTAAARASAADLGAQIAASAREVSTLREQLDQVQSEAVTDPLTSLKNRRGFDRSLQALLSGRTNGLAGCAMLMGDIDHFKRINDTYGHMFGDQVIKGVAQIIHATVKGGDLAARFGGEEFAVFLPDTSLEDAVALAEKIRSSVGRMRIKRSGTQEFIDQITISLGAAGGRIGEGLEALIERADKSLYRAKQTGRNRVESLSAAA